MGYVGPEAPADHDVPALSMFFLESFSDEGGDGCEHLPSDKKVKKRGTVVRLIGRWWSHPQL